MYNFIFIRGAQGTGKTTLTRLLKEKLNSVNIDFDWIRGFHLNRDWTNVSEAEEELTVENLVLLLKNYAKHDYYNVIIGGGVSEKLLEQLKRYKTIVFTLYLRDDEILKQRVLTETRDSGFRDYKTAIENNEKYRTESHFPNNHKIDSTDQTPEETASEIVTIINR
ncbi:MAG: AAA family ATPase [Candidatus Paceibacterota bacterium]|jgi:shikimate kinase